MLTVRLLQAPFAYVDDLSHVWCQWAEMELKHHNYRRAMQVLTRAVQEPDVTVAPKRMTADEHKVRAAHGGARAVFFWAPALYLHETFASATGTPQSYHNKSSCHRDVP